MKVVVVPVVALLLSFCAVPGLAQRNGPTAEDTLGESVVSSTSIGGYGDAVYQLDSDNKTSSMDLERVVLFVGHQFNQSISFFSELEMEDAKVSGGESGGEIAFEQAFLKFTLDRDHYVTAGLFLPRIGILNEDHLPTGFNGNERTQVETWILPSTWRELGVGFYGKPSTFPLNYSVALVNGLNSAWFEHGSGIREGRFEGRTANANNLAVTGALRWNSSGLRAQVSGYYGGTVGLSATEADSLGLASGVFGTPVLIGEADVELESQNLSIRALGTIVSVPDAFEIDRAYSNNTPQQEYGAYVEAAYDLFASGRSDALNLFVRYERLDLNSAIPSDGIIDGTLNQQHVIVGVCYLPIPNVVLKADVRIVHAGNENPALVSDPLSVQQYKNDNSFLNLGVGFSF